MSSRSVFQHHQLCKELCSSTIKSGHLPHQHLVPDEAQAVGDGNSWEVAVMSRDVQCFTVQFITEDTIA